MKWYKAAILLSISIGCLVQGLPLVAQNFTRIAAFPTDGPSIADTLEYINNALKPTSPGDDTVLSIKNDRLFLIDHALGIGESQSATLYAIDCHVIG